MRILRKVINKKCVQWCKICYCLRVYEFNIIIYVVCHPYFFSGYESIMVSIKL